MNKHITAVALVAAVALAGCGGTATSTPTVTKTTTKVDIRTETVKEVPEACLKALDLADEGFGYAGDALNAAQDGFAAIQDFDADALDAAAEDMKTAGDKTAGITEDYNSYKAQCRKAAS
jgi:hypothetical protein